MKLKYSARPAGYPVRDVVEIGFYLYRRLSGSVALALNSEGHLSVTVPVTWQQQIHTGEYHTIFNEQFITQLESEFQLDVPAATPEQIQLW